MDDPLAQEACTHGSTGPVEDFEQGVGAVAILLIDQEVEVALSCGIDQRELLAVFALEAVDMCDGTALIIAQIGDGGPSGANCRLHILTAEAFERLDLELIGEHIISGFGFEVPVFDPADGHSRQNFLQ